MKIVNFQSRAGWRNRSGMTPAPQPALPLAPIVLLPIILLGLCLGAGAQLESLVTAGLAGMDASQRFLLLTNITLGALGMPPLCAVFVLLWARRRRQREQGPGSDGLLPQGQA